MKDRVPSPDVETLGEIYGAEPAELLQIVRMASSSDPGRLMLVGHNPGLHELALMLAGHGDKAARKASPLKWRLAEAGARLLSPLL